MGQHEVRGISQADVWVFDARSSATARHAADHQLFGDGPAPWQSAGRQPVYAAVYRSGNQTTG
jgi:hypothetical protein